MNRVVHFFSYHNAVPIAVSIMLLGAGGVFAATNPEAIYSEEESVVSVDNTYIANKDFDAWTARITIGIVTEDEENYYVAYSLSTIDIVDGVWQDVTKDLTLKVAKGLLGEYGDLGLYVTKQLREVVDGELARLKETQKFERRTVTRKTIATEYNGLVGRFLDSTTEELPGYVPVVTPPPAPPPEPDPIVAEAPRVETPPLVTSPQDTPPQQGEVAGTSDEPEPPPSQSNYTLQILGDNPAQIPVGSTYTDLGVVADFEYEVTDVHIFLNGNAASAVTIDTTQPNTWFIRYAITTPDGSSVSATRKVVVAPQSSGGSGGSGSGTSTPPAPASSTPPQATTTPPADPPEPDPEPPAENPEPEPEPPPAPAPEPDPEPEPEPSPPPPEAPAEE